MASKPLTKNLTIDMNASEPHLCEYQLMAVISDMIDDSSLTPEEKNRLCLWLAMKYGGDEFEA